MSQPNTYTYFVRYTVRSMGGDFNGMAEYHLPEPISDFGQLEKIAKDLAASQNHPGASVVIDNFILLSAELTLVKDLAPKVEIVGSWRGQEKHREQADDIEAAEERIEDLSETNPSWSFEVLVDGEPLGAGR